MSELTDKQMDQLRIALEKRHAELAAAFDALLQDPARGPRLEQTLVRSLAASQAARREKASRKAASTKVDFFTMVRGDNA